MSATFDRCRRCAALHLSVARCLIRADRAAADRFFFFSEIFPFADRANFFAVACLLATKASGARLLQPLHVMSAISMSQTVHNQREGILKGKQNAKQHREDGVLNRAEAIATGTSRQQESPLPRRVVKKSEIDTD
jgi:hypothetical protein